MSNRIVELERAHQENTMLKSSIIKFRDDIQKQRANMHSSIPPAGRSKIMSMSLQQVHTSSSGASSIANTPSGSSLIPNTSSSSNQNSEIQILRQKINTLENELKSAQETISIQQKKWGKLKETVKKKKEGKGSGVSQTDSMSIFTDNLEPEQVMNVSSQPNAPAVLSPSSSSLYFSISRSNFSTKD
jgi:hypothetical protein